MSNILNLLSNIRSFLLTAGATVLAIWGIYYFFTNLFGENGKDPAKMATAVLMIVVAGAAFALIPTLTNAGIQTGYDLGGGR